MIRRMKELWPLHFFRVGNLKYSCPYLAPASEPKHPLPHPPIMHVIYFIHLGFLIFRSLLLPLKTIILRLNVLPFRIEDMLFLHFFVLFR